MAKELSCWADYPDFMTISQTQQLLNVGRATVYRWIEAGVVAGGDPIRRHLADQPGDAQALCRGVYDAGLGCLPVPAVACISAATGSIRARMGTKRSRS